MTNRVHIYTTRLQKATRFVVLDIGESKRGHWVRNEPLSLIRAWCCQKRRRAQNLNVQVFYGSIRFWCAEGKGCKAKKRGRA